MSGRAVGQLVRGLGPIATTALVAGNIIGSGIYVIPASLADAAGPLSLLAWPIVALGYLALNAVYADLAEAYPIQGGLQVYAGMAFGPLAALVTATLYWISCVVGNAAFMTAFVGYATVFFPVFHRPLAAFLLAQALLWTMTAVNVAGVKAGGAVQTVTTALKIVPLLILAAALLPHGTSANLIPFAPKGWGALFPAIALVAWPFLGSETATVPAEEITDPSRTIRRATFSGFGLAAVVYFLVALAVAAALPSAELAGSPSPMAVAARRVFGPAGESLIAIGALVSIAGILNGWILVAGRIPQAGARDGLFPRFLERLSPKTGAPVASLVVSGVMAALLASTYFSGTLLNAYNFIALASTATALIAIAMVCASLVVLVRRDPSKFRPAQRSRAPVFAAIGLVVVMILIRGSGWEVWGFTAAAAVLPIPFYLWTRARS
ncbi:MAG TPA: amino acid permease [Candidatus Polarisedimenticolaceae bacterium]|nr:amino acid permease [Candidatus Polarisedimenticolaceae bacterium]